MLVSEGTHAVLVAAQPPLAQLQLSEKEGLFWPFMVELVKSLFPNTQAALHTSYSSMRYLQQGGRVFSHLPLSIRTHF